MTLTLIVHPARARRTRQLARLNPADDWEEIYRRLVLWETPAEVRMGFQLAFYRPLAVPRMAEVFARTGHLRLNTMRRAYDTGLIIHEIIYGGFDSDRGQKMIALMNHMHDRPDIHPEDLTYVLNALIVAPTRMIDRTAWRPTTPAEREATCRWYRELGTRMHIDNLARTYADAEAAFDTYERDVLAPSPRGRELTAAVVDALRDRMPRPVRRHTATITSALIDDIHLSDALGLPRPPRPLTLVLRAGITVRKHLQRLLPPPSRPSFWPGRPAGAIYPDGYQLDQLGQRRSGDSPSQPG